MTNYMARFNFQGAAYRIDFICSYGGALSRSGRPAADYQITGDCGVVRFSSDDELQRGGVERAGLAAYKRRDSRAMDAWLRGAGFANRGQVYRSINRSRPTSH